MVGPYRTNVLVRLLFLYICFLAGQAPLFKDVKRTSRVNGLLVSKSFVPAALAVVLSMGMCVLEWAIPGDSAGAVGSALPALGKACQRIIT